MIATCPHCKNRFYVPVELAGKTVDCVRCKKPVQAPAKPAEAEDDSVTPIAESKAGGSATTLNGGRRINLHKGFIRLAFVLSLIACLILVAIDFPWVLGVVRLVGRPVFGAIVIVAFWVIYGLVLFVVKGFRDVKW